METKQLEDTIDDENGTSDIEILEGNKSCDKRESLYGFVKNRICESCEISVKRSLLGQLGRRCQACARKKDLVEKKLPHDIRVEDAIGEKKAELDYDVKDEPTFAVPTKYIMEVSMTSEKHWSDITKATYSENFAIEHEQVDILGDDVIKGFNEDVKVIKKKDYILLNKKESKALLSAELTPKKIKFGFSKGRPSVEKDTILYNEKKEAIVEILDVQKTKEEIELEKKERGWIVNGRSVGQKVIATNFLIITDGYSLGKEQKERDKIKKLKEKLDTQRILGLVAKRSKSRLTSPIHRPRDSNPKDDNIQMPYSIRTINNVIPTITLHEKNPEKSKSQEIYHEIISEIDSNSNHDDNKREMLHANIEAKNLSKPQSHVMQHDFESKCSLPTSIGCHVNDHLLYGTQRILELLAKRNGSRITSPKQRLESNIKEFELINTMDCNQSSGLSRVKLSNVVLHSSNLQDQHSKDLIMGETQSQTACNSNDLVQECWKEKTLHSKLDQGRGIHSQIHTTCQDTKPNYLSPTTNSCGFNNNPFYGTHQVLELVVQRSESNTTSPKQTLDHIGKEYFLTNENNNDFSNHDNMKITNVVCPSSTFSVENQRATPPKEMQCASTSYNPNKSIYKNDKGSKTTRMIKTPNHELHQVVKQIVEPSEVTKVYNDSNFIDKNRSEISMHSNVEQKTSNTQFNQVLSRQDTRSHFSTPTNTMCHVNDNPLYGTKSESEMTNFTIKNTNEDQLSISNSSPSPKAHEKYNKPPKTKLEVHEDTHKEVRTTIFVNNSLGNISSEMTPLYKSALANPIYKFHELNKKKFNSIFQIQPQFATKEVEIVEEESCSIPTINVQLKKNVKVEDLNDKNKKENKKRTQENNYIFDASNTSNINTLKNTKDRLNKNIFENKEMTFEHNSKINSWKNRSKSRIILWPIHLLVQGFGYPVKLVLKLMWFFVYILTFFVYEIIKPFKMLKKITCTGVGNVKSKFLKHAQNGCNTSQGYSGCGCATKTYILIVLCSILLPILFDLDFYLVNKFIEGQVVIRETLNFDYTKQHPVAEVNLLPQQIMGTAKGYFPDKEVMVARAFPPSHIFHMTIHLTIPESQYNHEIGMFQIVAKTFSAQGHLLNKASRATMLRYHSPLVKYMKSLVMGIPMVLGLSHESQTLSIKVMESQEESEISPTASVRVEIEPKAGHLTRLGVPEIYYGELQVIADNPYLREVARNWVWNLYMYSGLFLFVFEVLLVLCCCQKIFPQKPGCEEKIEEFVTKDIKTISKRRQKNSHANMRLYRQHIYFPKSFLLALPSTSNTIDSKNVACCGKITMEEIKVTKAINNSIPNPS